MKINDFRGDLTDNSAKKEALVARELCGELVTSHHASATNTVEYDGNR